MACAGRGADLARREGLAEVGRLGLADLRLRDRLGLDGDQERGAHPDRPGDLAGDLPERTGRVLAGGQTEEERQFVGGGRRVGPDGDGGRETPY
ncbi:hypothetical protein, partial [Streptomyces albidoflavus]|uniref:hypothetical protein n=1 Tax=Streptomyces albidoflavus TaxID=1886 RepID=UPI001C535C4F